MIQNLWTVSATVRFWVYIGDAEHPYSVYDFTMNTARDGGRILPKSALGKAITYARNQWEALRRYVSDGRLTIDNNVSERTLRLQAIGRKNWEFLGSADAGPRAAVLFTILAGAKRHRLEPWAYLRDVLLHMGAGATDLESLLPDRWGANHPQHVLQHRLDESRRKASRQKEARQRRRAIAGPKA